MVFLTFACFAKGVSGTRHFWRKQQYFRMSWKYYGRKRNCFSFAIRHVHRAMRYATIGRRLKPKNMQELWNTRLEAASQEHGLTAVELRTQLAEADVALNRKVLTDLAVYEPQTFHSLVEFAKQRQASLGLTETGLEKPPGIYTRY